MTAVLWSLPLVPLLAGLGIWAAGDRGRGAVGAAGLVATTATIGLAAWAAATGATTESVWGAGLTLQLDAGGLAGVVAVTVPSVALPIVGYAAAAEDRRGLARLVGLLVASVGAMELLVTAADLLTLLIGWELVAAASYALIGHHWRDADRPRAAAHAFNATRFGDLGLFLAAMAAFAGTGGLAYRALPEASGTAAHLLVLGLVVAAAAKSAQVVFAPWLFSAMAGPTSVSALLHAATMVAAGGYLLARLEPVLATVWWAHPTVLAIGLVTALAGGIVAATQLHAKRLLAASTSAHQGFVLVAVGAGFPLAGIAHLVTHAAFKALLFLTAGIGAHATGTDQLPRWRLGSHLRVTAGLAAVGGLALAALPPLGGAWSKEQVVAAAGHVEPWLAIAVIAAGGLSALYAARYQLLAFGPDRGDDPSPRQVVRPPGAAILATLAVLAAASVVAGAAWVPAVSSWLGELLPGGLPSAPTWELAASVAVIIVAGYAAWAGDRAGRLAAVGRTGATAATAEWYRLPDVVRIVVVDPTLTAARAAARFDARLAGGITGMAGAVHLRARRLASGDTRLVGGAASSLGGATHRLARRAQDLGERGVGWTVMAVVRLVGRSARDARGLQTGMAHHYLVIVVLGAFVVLLAAGLGR